MIIYACVVAMPVNFPGELEIHYRTLDRETGEPVAVFGPPFGSPRYFSWEGLKRKFSVGEALASECEGLLRQGKSAFIAQAQEWDGDWAPRGISKAAYAGEIEAKSKPQCSFCGKSHDIVGYLITSPTEPSAYICDECVAVLNTLIEEHRKTSSN